MKQISTLLSVMVVVMTAGVLAACGGTGVSETAPSSFSASTTGQTSSAVASDIGAREGNLRGRELAPVTDQEQAAAIVVLEQFSGTRIGGLTVEEVVMSARLSCAMANPDDRVFYDPAGLKESMRVTYLYHPEDSEIRFLPAMVERFCPELHPGDPFIEEIIADITSS